jgi:hypothetical protein
MHSGDVIDVSPDDAPDFFDLLDDDDDPDKPPPILTDLCPECECSMDMSPSLGFPVRMRYDCPFCDFTHTREV